jgi:hypothetical protein
MPILLTIMMMGIGIAGYITYKSNIFFQQQNGSNETNVLLKKLATAWIKKDYPKPNNFLIDHKYGYDRVGSSQDNTILFIGDSHTIHYWNTVGAIYKGHENLKSSTMFLTGQKEFPPQLNEKIYSDKSIKTVIFSYYWAYQYGSDSVSKLRRCGTHIDSCESSTSAKMDLYDKWFLDKSKKLKSAGKQVFFILDNPFGNELDPHFAFKRSWMGITTTPLKPLRTEDAINRLEPVRSRIVNIVKQAGATSIDPLFSLCKKDFCSVYTKDGEFMYQDYDHLSQHASNHDIDYLNKLYDIK